MTAEQNQLDASRPLVEISGLNLKGWEKPVEKLIETLGGGAGLLYEPRAIRERAKATADAAIILAEAEQEILELRQRGKHRRQDLEDRRQKNIESIATAAVRALPDRVSDQPVDEDWAYQFINHCQDVGSEKMQRIWAKILASEVTKPGSFSLRCLRVVADLNSQDATRFTNLCSFVWTQPERDIADDLYFLMITLRPLSPFVDAKVSYNDLLLMEHAGLLRIGDFVGFSMQVSEKVMDFFYFGRRVRISGLDPSNPDAQLPIGQVILTAVGAELVPIAGGEATEGYCESVVNWWVKDRHLTVALH